MADPGVLRRRRSRLFRGASRQHGRGDATSPLRDIDQPERGFAGGELVFPEFSRRGYRAGAGGAVVFSCSLMHLVTPVMAGRRLACLPFVFDEAAAATRTA